MEDFFNNIKESFTNAVLEFETINIKVDSTQWIETHEQLRDEFNLKFFSWLSAVDWDNDVSVGEAPKESVTPCFELITCLSDVENTNLITVSTTIDKSEPQIDSLVEIYEGANWHEREAYEMFGISFANHPNLEKLYLTIKKLSLNIIDKKEYYSLAHKLGVPEKGLINLKDQLFGLEANFELFQAIDFKKGCFVGQENTARMKLKNKLRRRLLPISSSKKLNIGDEITFNDIKIGKILIDQPYPFGLIKVFEPNLEDFKDKVLLANNKECKILENV